MDSEPIPDDNLGEFVLERGVEGDLYNPHPRTRACEIAGCVPMGDVGRWFVTDDGAYHRKA